MLYNRAYLKHTARVRLRKSAVPSIMSVTLVFLLLNKLLTELSALLYYNDYVSYYESIISNSSVSSITSIASQFYSGSAFLIMLFVIIFMSLFSVVITAGYRCYCMKIVRNQQDAGYHDLSYGLELLPKVVCLAIYQGFLIFCWSLLFLIPGIVAFYRYRMAIYILLDDPEISVMEAVYQSKELLLGHKATLLTLDISFIGWALLVNFMQNFGEQLSYSLAYIYTGHDYLANAASIVVGFACFLVLGVWYTAYYNLSQVYFYELLRGANWSDEHYNHHDDYDYQEGQSSYSDDFHSSRDNSPWG